MREGSRANVIGYLSVAPYVVFAHPLVGLIVARSEVPTVLGRYSPFLAVMIAVCLAIYAVGIGELLLGREALRPWCLLALAAVSYLVPGNNAGQRLYAITFVLPAVRVLCGVALVLSEFVRSRTAGRPRGAFLGLGALLCMFSALDLVIAGVARAPAHAATGGSGFRQSYDLNRIPQNAIVLIGDSFVWGQGVAAHESFGARLEQALRAEGRARSVYSLGLVGGELNSALRTLAQIPERQHVGRIVLSYYINDMPPKGHVSDLLRNQLLALGKGAGTLRVVGDALGRMAAPNLQAYHASLVDDYDPRDGSYAARFAMLDQSVARFRELAAARSDAPPLFLILPLMLDFRSYPLRAAHERLQALARQRGFEVLDLLPVFTERLVDGSRHLAAPNDNHFDAATHALVANALRDALLETPPR